MASFRFHAVGSKTCLVQRQSVQEKGSASQRNKLSYIQETAVARYKSPITRGLLIWRDVQEATLPYKLMFQWFSFGLDSLLAT